MINILENYRQTLFLLTRRTSEVGGRWNELREFLKIVEGEGQEKNI